MPIAEPPGDESRHRLDDLLEQDPADLYENAPCGYLSTTPDGTIVKVNRTLCLWLGRPAAEVLGSRFAELLSLGGRVFHETHFVPLLRVRGAVREVAVDVVRVDGSLLSCLLNAVEVRGADGGPQLVRVTLFDATARRRYEQELVAARRTAEQLENRARTLHEVVSALAAASTVDEVAAVLVDRGRRALGARGAAFVTVDDSAGPDPGLRIARSTGLPENLVPELEAAAHGRLVLTLAEGVRPVPLDDRLRDQQPAVAEVMAAGGLTGLVVVPVTADGRYLGVLVVGLGPEPGALIELDTSRDPGIVAPAELELLTTLGRQAGQALERARLHEQTLRQAERAAFLLEAARLMAGASGVVETVERLAELAVQRLADVCIIELLDDHGIIRTAARHRDPARQRWVDELRDRHPSGRRGSDPGTRALAAGRTYWVRHLDDAAIERLATGPRQVRAARQLGLVSVAGVPLAAAGRPLGTIILATDVRRGPFSPADIEVAEQLALQVSQVVDKAQRYEFEARTSHTLQANLLPPAPPSVPGLSVAVRYMAASLGVEIGGDFYDVAALPERTVAVAVGDVVGHDITAAATMGQLRAVYRALLVERPEPSAVIDRLQASWPFLGLQRMATALFATLDPANGRLRIASAGHPPPVLLSPDGSATLLPVRPTRMLGAPPAPSAAVEWEGVLAPGATLLLYTDGLVESRTADIDDGLARLLSAASSAITSPSASTRPSAITSPSGAVSPDELCDRLLEMLAAGHRTDDIALLALTRDP